MHPLHRLKTGWLDSPGYVFVVLPGNEGQSRARPLGLREIPYTLPASRWVHFEGRVSLIGLAISYGRLNPDTMQVVAPATWN